MAGGKGTRFWPASTEEKPKQFLNLLGNRTMLQMTVDRLLPLIPMNRIFVCVGENYKQLCFEQLPNLPKENIIIEPEGKNTAPCIMLSSVFINNIYKNANLIVVPSDHVIKKQQEFLEVLQKANKYLDEQGEGIITLGIKPSRPETGYGYINYSNPIDNQNFIYEVIQFVEKPDLEKAKQYINDGKYLWNAGMFIFKIEYMLTQFDLHSHNIYKALVDLPNFHDADYDSVLAAKYSNCEAISIDYAIMEKCNKLYVIPADLDWDDVGSWSALQRYLKKDSFNNISNQNVLFENSFNNVVFSEDDNVILLDVDDLFVIQVENKLIIGKKESISKVHLYKETSYESVKKK
ncbi:mannose-1-phosphate guanylyltransferase [Faecalicoccus acidiformans]|uniref:mannose-1-phosphate guanylyltransferase n=1 Tax=Faecalicoccus acidiformans TaxID=915173 RepID=A0A7W8FXK4_9FIRM|nr:mannose-1-phosphate guanylyltransferase [Faecalicoccus acidiformans]MBB5185408.1 mannose-1-phosphate guanylyltransferase [Faecalicoccus acidiformans]